MLKRMVVAGALCVAAMAAGEPARAFDGIEIAQVKQRAEKGDAAAQSKLGVLYSTGVGMRMDKKEAVKWYRKAADQGYPVGEWNLAFMYVRGEGVEADLVKARELFTRAAETGFANAQYDLGVMFLDGLGGTQDRDEAKKWFSRAAGQGYRDAKKMLEELNAPLTVAQQKQPTTAISTPKGE
ncbi:sel1 repeat family protein [Geomonas sp. Red32]|uniref:tetratricopeptide repeat protein n=1 Tax=Geomonas sp. Red32 TaxID=2912856 RepID=UPI00202D02E1|nr:tetratricopeptide repeat protein [Geomonas sp. Red32]MCM0083552.1 sel1 repeat family protein [Geomonas sp. Red32]